MAQAAIGQLMQEDHGRVFNLKRIDRRPQNFGDFVEEIAAGLSGLYGERAAAEYRATATQVFNTSITHPHVDAIALCKGDKTAALLFAAEDALVGRISFIHVLREYAGRGLEERLVQEAVRTLRAGGVEGILGEYIAFCPLDLEATYQSLGFRTIERILMGVSLNASGLDLKALPESKPLDEKDWTDVAGLIVTAYQSHPGRELHSELRDVERARKFVERAAGGGYGATQQNFARVIKRRNTCVGAIIGCRVSPDFGFVIQVVVHPECQRQGMGTLLIQELGRAFRKEGLSRMALGVTAANRARKMYERLGFETLRTVNAYAWWRPGGQIE